MGSDTVLRRERGDNRDQKMVDRTEIDVVITSNENVVDLIDTAPSNKAVTVQQ